MDNNLNFLDNNLHSPNNNLNILDSKLNIMDNNLNIIVSYHNNNINNIIHNIIKKKQGHPLMHQFLIVLLHILLKIQCIISNINKNLRKSKNGFRMPNLNKAGYLKGRINSLRNTILTMPKLPSLNRNKHKFQLNLILISMTKKFKKNVSKRTLIFLICFVNMMKHHFQN